MSNNWALKLYSRSPLKQKKFAMLKKMLGKFPAGNCLDIGSDNGVISYLLRQEGGIWFSADLIPETVESIKSLVNERVLQIDGVSLPFDNEFFEAVLIVDFLEHIGTDKEMISEIHRVLKKDGVLIINVPNPKEGLLRKIRFALGQTDEAHGHLRPGYTLSQIKELLGGSYEIQKAESYSRLFADLIDTFITAGIKMLKKNSASAKGSVVTGQDLNKMAKMFKLYNLIFPIMWLFSKLDEICPFLHGNMLIVRAIKR